MRYESLRGIRGASTMMDNKMTDAAAWVMHRLFMLQRNPGRKLAEDWVTKFLHVETEFLQAPFGPFEILRMIFLKPDMAKHALYLQ